MRDRIVERGSQEGTETRAAGNVVTRCNARRRINVVRVHESDYSQDGRVISIVCISGELIIYNKYFFFNDTATTEIYTY